MKILLIGSTSSLSQSLIPKLEQIGTVITAGRKNCDFLIDLSDAKKSIVLPRGIDVLIHTAAHFGGETDSEILEAENVNVLGTLKICQAAVQAMAKHFILISSMSAILKENSEYYGIYALSKRHSEEIAKFYCSIYSLPLTILRPSQIYGNQDNFSSHQPFIYSMIDNAEKGEPIRIYGSKDAIRNYIHIDDLNEIILRATEQKIEGTYSCMSPTDVAYSRVANAALDAFQSKGSLHFLKDKEDIPDNIFEKDNSLYEKINFYPQISIEAGMKMIAEYRSKSK